MQATTETTAQPGDLDALLAELAQGYDAETARIDRSIARVDAKLEEIRATKADTEAVLDSLVNVKTREYDTLMVEGKPEEAAQKLRDAEAAKAMPAKLSDAMDDLVLERACLENDLSGAAKKVLDETMPQVVTEIHSQVRALCATLDRIETTIKEFIEQAGSGIDPTPYIASLVPDKEDEGRKKWFSVEETLYVWRNR
jgi:prefoldin subunit 5